MAESELSSLESVTDDEDDSRLEAQTDGTTTARQDDTGEEQRISTTSNGDQDAGVIDISEGLPDTPETTPEGKGRVAHADRVAYLLSQCYKDCRHLVRLRMFKSITRHLACCSPDDLIPDKANLPNDAVVAFMHAYTAAPKRHQVQFVAPAQDLLFCLKQIESQCPNLFIQPDLIRQVNMIVDTQSEPPLVPMTEISSDLAASAAAAPGNLPALPSTSAALSSAQFRARSSQAAANRKTGRAGRYFQDQAEEIPLDLNLPPERLIQIVQPAAFSPRVVTPQSHANALLGNMGAMYNLQELTEKVQQTVTQQTEPEMAELIKNFITESNWIYVETESKPLETLDFGRARNFAQLVNKLGSRLCGPRPKMPALFHPPAERGAEGTNAKRRKIEGRGLGVQTQPNNAQPGGVVAKYSGRLNTIWESLQVRKILHIEDVENLWLLKNSLTSADLNQIVDFTQIRNGSVIGNQSHSTFFSRPTPQHILKSYGESKLSDWDRSDHLSFCGLCGAAFNRIKHKQLHLKAHFIRIAPQIPLILSPRGDMKPPRLSLGPWLSGTAKNSGFNGTSTRCTALAADIASHCGTNSSPQIAQSVETLVSHVRKNEQVVWKYPQRVFVPFEQVMLEPEQAVCGVCEKSVDFEWYDGMLCYSDALWMQRPESDSGDSMTTQFLGIPGHSTVPYTSHGSGGGSKLRDVERLVAGPPGSNVRDLLAHTFTRARNLSRLAICPEILIPIMLKFAKVLGMNSTGSSNSVDPFAALADMLKRQSREAGFPLKEDLMEFHLFMDAIVTSMRKDISNRASMQTLRQPAEQQTLMEKNPQMQVIYSFAQTTEGKPLVHSSCLQFEQWRRQTAAEATR